MKPILLCITLVTLILTHAPNTHAYPYFPECSLTPIDANLTVLNTLNGAIRGTCYNVTVNYASKAKSSSLVMTWLSIPYAKPPLKTLRYKNPLPIETPWSSTVLDGTKWPSKCLQEYGKSTQNNSEDCLYLNLFVPFDAYKRDKQVNNTGAPILVWIHGGSLKSGSSSEDEFEPSTLVAMTNIIVVNINYRLGAFGFMHIKGIDIKDRFLI